VSSRRAARVTAEVQDLSDLLKRIGSSQVELADILNPHVYQLMMHPFTKIILDEYPEYGQLLADIAAIEKVGRLSGLDADEKLIDLGIIMAARDTLDREARKRRKESDAK